MLRTIGDCLGHIFQYFGALKEFIKTAGHHDDIDIRPTA
jgi:hypothetical protein